MPSPPQNPVTENGVPDWKIVTPLIVQFAQQRPFTPWRREEGKVVVVAHAHAVGAIKVGKATGKFQISLSSLNAVLRAVLPVEVASVDFEKV